MSVVFRSVWIAALLFITSTPAFAQDYPTRPIKLVVPQPAGSATDNTARFLAVRLAAELGVSVVVENRDGADGKIGSQYVARSEPDGYNILLGNTSTHSGNFALSKTLSYNPVKDFIPVGGVQNTPLLLTVAPEFAADGIQGLIKIGRERELLCGTRGVTPRVATEFLALSTGIKCKNVPYRGAMQALGDLIGGRIDMLFADPSSAQALLEAGKVKALGTTGKERLPLLPNVPTFSEAGVPDFELVSWIAGFVPTGTPSRIVDKLSNTFSKIVGSDEMRTYLASVGAQPFHMNPKEMAKYIEEDIAKWTKIVKAAGIEPQ